jgi:hypothetical protein
MKCGRTHSKSEPLGVRFLNGFLIAGSCLIFRSAGTIVMFAAWGIFFGRTRKQYFAGEFEFSGPGINIDQFHLDLIALFDAGIFYSFQPFPVYFGDVE